MELCSALTLLKVIQFLALYPSFSGRLGQSRIRVLKSNKNINGKLSFWKKKNLPKKYRLILHVNSVYFIKMMFELRFKVFSFKRLVLKMANGPMA